MWKDLSFKLKVYLMVFVFIMFSLITGAGYHFMANSIRDIGIQSSSDTMLEGYRGEIKDIVDLMAQSLASASENLKTEEEEYKVFSNLINKARFFPDKSGYIFIYKSGGEVFVLPPKTQLEGKNLLTLKDANGKMLIKELNEVANNGGGFVDYMWDKPGKGNTPKISYARMIPNKPYWLGTGVYVDNIKEKEAKIFNSISDYSKNYLLSLYGILAVIFFLVILPLISIMIKSIVRPLTQLTETAVEYSRGKLDKEFENTNRKDEIGQLTRAVKRLGKSTKIVMDKLQEIT